MRHQTETLPLGRLALAAGLLMLVVCPALVAGITRTISWGPFNIPDSTCGFVNDYFVWTVDQDPGMHTVTSGNATAQLPYFDSGWLPPSRVFRYSNGRPIVIPYFSRSHANMTSKIIVYRTACRVWPVLPPLIHCCLSLRRG